MLDLGFETYAAAGAICVEMKCSTLFIVGTMRRVRTGAIVAIDARSAAAGEQQPRPDLVPKAIDREIKIALEAVVLLASPSARRLPTRSSLPVQGRTARSSTTPA